MAPTQCSPTRQRALSRALYGILKVELEVGTITESACDAAIDLVLRASDIDHLEDPRHSIADEDLELAELAIRRGTLAARLSAALNINEEWARIIIFALRPLSRRPPRTLDQAFEDAERNEVVDVETLIALASSIGDLNTRQRLYERAVETGRAEFAASPRTLSRNADGHLSMIFDARPYLCAKMGLAETLLFTGALEEAAREAEDILKLDRRDGTGARFILQAALLRLDRRNPLTRVLRKDESHFAAYNAALLAYREGERESVKVLGRAIARAPLIADLLADERDRGSTRSLMLPYTNGGLDEAELYLGYAQVAWRATPGAVAWLRQTLAAYPDGIPPAGWDVEWTRRIRRKQLRAG